MTGWQRLSVAGMGGWTLLTGLWAWTDWFEISHFCTSAFTFCSKVIQSIDGQEILTVWLAPPSLVFLVVWTTRWVNRGFRDK